VEAAERDGAIYRLARAGLAVGPSEVAIPQGAHWDLLVTFPDGKTALLDPNNREEKNEFGTVKATGPNPKGDDWSLRIDVRLK
jgi:hypothetical protein